MRTAFLLSLLLMGACVSHDFPGPQRCGVSDPVQELPWLKDLADELSSSGMSEYWYITSATYEHETVFLVRNCCPFCLTVTPVYDCAGALVFRNLGDHAEDIRSERIIWTPVDYVCTF